LDELELQGHPQLQKMKTLSSDGVGLKRIITVEDACQKQQAVWKGSAAFWGWLGFGFCFQEVQECCKIIGKSKYFSAELLRRAKWQNIL